MLLWFLPPPVYLAVAIPWYFLQYIAGVFIANVMNAVSQSSVEGLTPPPPEVPVKFFPSSTYSMFEVDVSPLLFYFAASLFYVLLIGRPTQKKLARLATLAAFTFHLLLHVAYVLVAIFDGRVDCSVFGQVFYAGCGWTALILVAIFICTWYLHTERLHANNHAMSSHQIDPLDRGIA